MLSEAKHLSAGPETLRSAQGDNRWKTSANVY